VVPPPTFTLTPGKSYVYKSTATGNKTLTFVDCGGKDVAVEEQGRDHHWTPIEGNLYNMTLNGVILIDGVEQHSTTLEVGAFCGDECRASEYASFFPPTNQYVVTLTILSNVASGETITFKLYDPDRDLEMDGTNTVDFVNLNQIGTMGDWYQLEFVTPEPTGFHFTVAGNWSVAANWQGGALPGANDAVSIDADCALDQDAAVASLTVSDNTTLTLQSGKTLTVSGDLVNAIETDLVIEDGAQLVNASANVSATVEKDIVAYSANNPYGWFTIASPMDAMAIEGSDFLTPEYDLYRYNETSLTHEEWENYKYEGNAGFTAFENGRGYLYANSNTFSPTFTGTLNNAAVNYALTYTECTDGLEGFNLVGNPFPHVIYKGAGGSIDDAKLASGFYTLTNEGAWHVHTFEDAILPGQGILVKTSEAVNLTIAKSNTASTAESGGAKAATGRLGVSVEGADGHDRAFVYFSQGVGLDKMDNFSELAPKLWIRDNGNDYAIAHVNNDYEALDLYFGNRQAGDYTLTVNAKDTNFNYLRLIDNLTGANVDLLEQPGYSFHAAGNETEARFRLEFKVTTGVGECQQEEQFAYVSDGNIIVNGTGTLQVIDVVGRQLYIHEINSAFRIPNSTFPSGVYLLRLVNGESVRIQKIVLNN